MLNEDSIFDIMIPQKNSSIWGSTQNDLFEILGDALR